jgi:hypothetical protein
VFVAKGDENVLLGKSPKVETACPGCILAFFVVVNSTTLRTMPSPSTSFKPKIAVLAYGLFFAALVILAYGLYATFGKSSRSVPSEVPPVRTLADMSVVPKATPKIAPPYTLQINLTKPYKDNLNLVTVVWRNPPPNIKQLFFVYDSLKFDYTDAAFAFYYKSFPDFGSGRLLEKGDPHPDKQTDRVVWINEDNLSYDYLGSIEFVFPTTKEADFLTSTRFFYIDTDGTPVCIQMPSEFTPSGPPLNYRSW